MSRYLRFIASANSTHVAEHPCYSKCNTTAKQLKMALTGSFSLRPSRRLLSVVTTEQSCVPSKRRTTYSVLISPFVTFFGLPVYTVAGAALMGTFVTSVAGVAFYQAIAPFYPHMSVAPDWFLGILFGLGGMAGMYLGARFQKFVPAKAIKWMLAGVIVLTAFKYVASYFGL